MFNLTCAMMYISVLLSFRSSTSSKPSNGPDCTCGIHVALSRTHLGMMNDTSRRQILTDVLTKVNYFIL